MPLVPQLCAKRCITRPQLFDSFLLSLEKSSKIRSPICQKHPTELHLSGPVCMDPELSPAPMKSLPRIQCLYTRNQPLTQKHAFFLEDLVLYTQTNTGASMELGSGTCLLTTGPNAKPSDSAASRGSRRFSSICLALAPILSPPWGCLPRRVCFHPLIASEHLGPGILAQFPWFRWAKSVPRFWCRSGSLNQSACHD